MFERVLTMTDYYDGPRRGIADLDGVPHFYESEWASGEDLDMDVFKLSPVQETHPALPADRARHAELEALLKDRVGVDATQAIRASGTFRARPDLNVAGLGFHPLEVEWRRL